MSRTKPARRIYERLRSHPSELRPLTTSAVRHAAAAVSVRKDSGRHGGGNGNGNGRGRVIDRGTQLKWERKQIRKVQEEVERLGREEKGRLEEEKVRLSVEMTKDLPPLTEQDILDSYEGLMSAPPESLYQLSAPSTSPNLLGPPSSRSASKNSDLLERLSSRLDGRLEEGEGDLVEFGGKKEGIAEDVDDGLEYRNLADSLTARRKGKSPDRPSLRLPQDGPSRTVPDPFESSTSAAAAEEPARDASSIRRTDPRSIRRMALVSKLEERISAAESSQASTSAYRGPLMRVNLGVATRDEWKALVAETAHFQSVREVEGLLDLMKRSGAVVDLDVIHAAANSFARKGMTQEVMEMMRLAGEDGIAITPDTHHYILKSHLRHSPPSPTLALAHLRQMEANHQTPTQKSYTLVISHLLTHSQTPHAWDLFAHSRLVSHPVPDEKLYTTMIQACGSGRDTASERAMDLFIEMTEDHRIPPTSSTYNGLIRAFARDRDGGEGTYLKSLMLLREMMAKGLKPDRTTFHSILEGSKRFGDLQRARWILMRMVQIDKIESERGSGEGKGKFRPNDITVGLVLQCYASHKPVYRKEDIVSSHTTSTRSSTSDDSPHRTAQHPLDQEDDGTDLSLSRSDEGTSSELHGYPGPMPQTKSEIFGEASRLFELATSTSTSFEDFSVRPSAYLYNSFLTVHSAHGNFSGIVEVFRMMEDGGSKVRKDAWTYEILMGACDKRKDSEVAWTVAKEVFGEWRERGGDGGRKWTGENVRKMWASWIKTQVRANRLQEAYATLREFVDLYPPEDIHETEISSNLTPISSSPSPASPRLQMHISSPIYPETFTPSNTPTKPYLTFPDLKLLHHSAADIEERAIIAYIKATCLRYEGALRSSHKRRVREMIGTGSGSLGGLIGGRTPRATLAPAKGVEVPSLP